MKYTRVCLLVVGVASGMACTTRRDTTRDTTKVKRCTPAGCGGLAFAFSMPASSGSRPDKVLICHSDQCRESALIEWERDPRPDSRSWHASNPGVQWFEQHGIAYFSGQGGDPREFRLPTESWRFRVTSADGGVLLERMATVTYRQAEINGPGCGVCISARIAD